MLQPCVVPIAAFGQTARGCGRERDGRKTDAPGASARAGTGGGRQAGLGEEECGGRSGGSGSVFGDY
ncbi:hypothetical protein E2562_029372 [Oryza meyeriana var. granulata]|uniref:Uncharacterized protein n=1 Tax=Oryza meyeriana var. granulata TaxID=110450 RepID=A0A6G1C0K4_9ORYZ|nr:hypothetical protein E2562_029372 [Oryza meyeriana var. granulata]